MGNNNYFAAHKDDCGAQLLLQRGNSAKLLSFQLATFSFGRTAEKEHVVVISLQGFFYSLRF